ncbi:MAG: hypothetical protein MJZ61_10310 [Bacteroidales bacterium]|nr:hypothetical protein [Bacteroidales bacterium]
MQTDGNTYDLTDEQLHNWYLLLNDNEGKRTHYYYSLLSKYSLPAWGIESLEEPIQVSDEKFKTIYAFNGVICTVEDYSIVKQTLRNFYDMLDDGGVLLIDLPAQWKKLCNADQKTWQVGRRCTNPETGETFSYSYYDEVDFTEQLFTTHFRYEVSINNVIKAVKTDTATMRWYGVHEFETLLSEAGFDSIKYQTIMADENSSFILFEAVK